jgi:spermidine/putrescine transport system permease protein
LAWADFRRWAKDNHVTTSQPRFTVSKLNARADHDVPALSSKAYNSRVVTAYLAEACAGAQIANNTEEGLLNALVAWLQPAWAPLGLIYTPAAVVTGLVYSYLPFLILPVYASVEKLDGALIEAAHDLGAGPWRVFPTVILPLTLPGIAAGVTLVFVPAVAMFAVTDLLGGARVPLIGNVIQNQFLQARDWPFGAALGVALLGLFLVSQLVLRALRPRGALRE